MNGSGAVMKGQQHVQLEARLREAIQTVIARGLNDPRIRGLVTVTGVHLSPDGAEATVGVSILPADASELSMHGLRHAMPHVQARVANALSLRRMPRLILKLDESLKKEAAVIAAINEARRREDGGAEPGRRETP